MAGQTIKGITIELVGSTTKLGKALKEVESYSKELEKQLKEVETALKLDPDNTELLAQKQRILAEQVETTRKKLELLKKAQDEAAKSVDNFDAWQEAYKPIQEQLDKTKKKITELQAEQMKLERAGEVDTEPYRELSEQIDSLKGDLKDLHKQSEEVTEQFGNPISTKEFEKLQTEVAVTEVKLKDVRKEADKVADKLKAIDSGELHEVEEAADKAKASLKGAKDEAASFGDVLKAGVISEAAGRLMDTVGDLTQETKEYRKIMSSLDVSSEAAGYSADQTREAYKSLYGVLADDQSAATTVANLQALNLSQGELLKLIDSTIGGWAKYGDSIPIDGLAEAINETVKSGRVTGTFADILNWGAKEGETYGVAVKDITDLQKEYNAIAENGADLNTEWMLSVEYGIDTTEAYKESLENLLNGQTDFTESMDQNDAATERCLTTLQKIIDADTAWNKAVTDATNAEEYFNLALQQCATEEERLNLIMQTMANQGLEAIGQKWKENNATLIESNEVNADLQEQMALLGEMIEPITTDITELLVEALGWFNGLDDGTQKFLLGTVAVIAALGPVGSAFDGVSEVVKLLSDDDLPKLTGVFGNLTGTVLPGVQSVFSSVFGFIAAHPVVLLIGAIVGLVALIGTKGDEIQAILQAVDDFLQSVFAVDWTEIFGPVLGGVLNDFCEIVKGIWDSIKKIFDGIIDFIRGVFTQDWDRAWRGVVGIFEGIFSGLSTILKAPINAVIGLINEAIGGINWLIDGVNKIPGVDISRIGTIPLLASGGEVLRGSAIVGEAGPELLTVLGDRTVVHPLSHHTTHTTQMGGVNLHVYGAPGQNMRELAEIVMEELQGLYDSEEAGL